MNAAGQNATGASTKASRFSGMLLFASLAGAIALIALGAAFAGRRDEQLSSVYGRRRGQEGLPSVNGTAILAELFKKAGHRVSLRSRFSPRLDDFDVVVWFPDDFKPPTKEQRNFLAGWLQGGATNRPRTLVYVGRDYDAAVDYWDEWRQLASEAPVRTADEVLRRQSEARASHENARSEMPEEGYAQWFTAKRDGRLKQIDTLEGPWAAGIDAEEADLHLEGQLAVPEEDEVKADDDPIPEQIEVLLGSGDDALVTRLKNDIAVDGWGNGQVIVVANGSFLLNYALINAEHRKLAARLVSECGKAGPVAFVESGAGGPPVLEKEPAGGPPTALDMLKVWPLNAILLHLAALGIVFCLARSPIFGRPRELGGESPVDFGKHVAALGQLLARTRDRNYAQARLAQYQQATAAERGGRPRAK